MNNDFRFALFFSGQHSNRFLFRPVLSNAFELHRIITSRPHSLVSFFVGFRRVC